MALTSSWCEPVDGVGSACVGVGGCLLKNNTRRRRAPILTTRLTLLASYEYNHLCNWGWSTAGAVIGDATHFVTRYRPTVSGPSPFFFADGMAARKPVENASMTLWPTSPLSGSEGLRVEYTHTHQHANTCAGRDATSHRDKASNGVHSCTVVVSASVRARHLLCLIMRLTKPTQTRWCSQTMLQ